MTRWALLSGPRGTGLSQLAADVAALLAARGLRVGGFAQAPCGAPHAGAGYRLLRLDVPEAIVLARPGAASPEAAASIHCSYVFDATAWLAARRWLREAAPDADVLVIDEVGKLEGRGRGHDPALAEALGAGPLVLLSVRAEQLLAVMERHGLDAPVAALEAATGAGIPGLVDAIVATVRPQASA